MSYSLDFRQRVLTIKQQEKLTILQTAQRFQVSMRTLFRWKKCPHPSQKQPRPARKIDMDALKKDVECYPDAYLKERAQRFQVSPTGLYAALKRLGVSRKKKSSTSEGRRRFAYRLPKKDKRTRKSRSTDCLSR